MKKNVLLLILFFHFSTLASVEEKYLCVKYKTNYGWSKNYKVKATVLDGYELYYKTYDSKYNMYSTYVVIFWQPEQASIIELDYHYISYGGTNGKDQESRKWIVSDSTYCY
jgi:hypothetical protein